MIAVVFKQLLGIKIIFYLYLPIISGYTGQIISEYKQAYHTHTSCYYCLDLTLCYLFGHMVKNIWSPGFYLIGRPVSV